MICKETECGIANLCSEMILFVFSYPIRQQHGKSHSIMYMLESERASEIKRQMGRERNKWREGEREGERETDRGREGGRKRKVDEGGERERAIYIYIYIYI